MEHFTISKAKTLFTALMLISNSLCLAHSGNSFVAQPTTTKIQIDGDLSDWPESTEYKISTPYVFNGKPESGDFTGRFRIVCDYQQDLLFVAVDIRDDDIRLESQVDQWNSRDACEIFLTLQHSRDQRVPLQFVYRNEPIVAEADKPNDLLKNSFDVVRRHEGNRLIYEWQIDLAALPNGKGLVQQPSVIGFDVGYIDLDEDDEISVFSSSPGRAKHLTSATLGDLLLTVKADSLVNVAGEVIRAGLKHDEAGEQAKRSFAPVAIQSLDASRFYAQVPCDEQGRYSAQLPPGKYTASLIDTLPVRISEKESIEFEVKAGLESTTLPSLKMRPLRKPALINDTGLLLRSKSKESVEASVERD